MPTVRKGAKCADRFVVQSLGLGLTARQVRRVHKLVQAAGAEKLEAACSDDTYRHAMQRFTKDMFVKEPLVLADGSTWTLRYADPCKLVECVLNANDEVFAQFDQAWSRQMPTPTQPWDVVVGCDEAWCGNILAASGRKVMVLSFTFKQFGRSAVTLSSSWFTPMIVRQLQYKRLPGQWSQVLALFVRRMFLSTSGVGTEGAVLHVRGKQYLLYARWSLLVCDGDGWRQCIESKGASGVRCCPLCSNVVSRADLVPHGHNLVTCACSDMSKCELLTPASLMALIRSLYADEAAYLAGRMTKARRDMRLTAAGFVPTLHGIWSDPAVAECIKPTETLCMDWVHNCLQDGVFSDELEHYMDSNDDAGMESLTRFLGLGWRFAGRSHNGTVPAFITNLRKAFAAKSMRGHTRPTATEQLNVVSLLRLWASDHVDSVGKRAFAAVCALVHGIQRAKYLAAMNHAALLPLAKEVAKLHADYVSAAIAARGPDASSGFAKQHWLGHIAAQLVRDGGVYDTFPIERLHRRVKAHAKPICNTTDFERTIVQRVIADHCNGFGGGKSELGKHTPILATCILALHGTPILAASRMCTSQGTHRYAAGDFVECDGEVGEVLQFVAVNDDGKILAVAHKCDIANCAARYWGVVKRSSSACVWPVASLNNAMVAVAARDLGAGFTVVLWPR